MYLSIGGGGACFGVALDDLKSDLFAIRYLEDGYLHLGLFGFLDMLVELHGGGGEKLQVCLGDRRRGAAFIQ